VEYIRIISKRKIFEGYTLMDLNFSLGAAGLFDFQGIGISCKLSLRLGAGEAVGGPLLGAGAGAGGEVGPAAGVAAMGVTKVVVEGPFSGFLNIYIGHVSWRGNEVMKTNWIR
jgi:hypothetical protein